MKRVHVALALVVSLASARAAERPDRVVLLDASDPVYAGLAVPDVARFAPASRTRLVVFRDGRCVLDRGLREERRAGPRSDRKETLVETGLVEQAYVAPDGRAALLVTVRYRDSVDLAETGPARDGEGLRGKTSLAWIDPAHPDGRWRFDLEPGRFVVKAIVLSRGQGAALSTSDVDGGAADFRLVGTDGRVVFTIPVDRASTGDVVATEAGGFVAVDLAYRPGDGVPDRGVLVLDLLQGREWTYTWDYGSEREPLGWTLENTGILDVRLPGRTVRFDRNGRPLK